MCLSSLLDSTSSSAAAMTLPLERTDTLSTYSSNLLHSSLRGLVMLAPLSPTHSRTHCFKNSFINIPSVKER